MPFEIDRAGMRAYILNKFNVEGDFEFMGEELLSSVVELMLDTDAAYIESLDGEDYDDDEAYDLLYAAVQKRYPDYKMYAMRLSEDYLDFQEEYLVSVDGIEWE